METDVLQRRRKVFLVCYIAGIYIIMASLEVIYWG